MGKARDRYRGAGVDPVRLPASVPAYLCRKEGRCEWVAAEGSG